MEASYEARLKADWDDLQGRIFTIARLDSVNLALGMTRGRSGSSSGAKDGEAFTFSPEQRAAIMKALEGFLGRYEPGDADSPVVRYYGESYSLGLIQAAQLIGEERPILDIIRNRETFGKLVQTGFDLVKDNATRAIANRILPEMEAHVLAGSNPLSVAARLKKLFGDQNSSWERLARTEIAQCAELAKLDEWKKWDVKRVEFSPAPDACPICQALAGDYDIGKCPVPGRDTHPRCRCSIRPAASEVGSEPETKGTGLAHRFPVESIDDLGSLLQAFDRENQGLMINGFQSISQVDASYFMATIPPHGEFFVSTSASVTSGGFHPSSDLVGALRKIRNGGALTFNEEYSVESLWHEICHNRAEKYAHPTARAARMNMEALNQLVARHTYPDFLKQLGGEAVQAGEVLDNGYGYGVMVRNLRALLAKLGLDEAPAIRDFEKILYRQKYDRVQSNLAGYLAKKSGTDRSRIMEILAEIDLQPDIFVKLLGEVAG